MKKGSRFFCVLVLIGLFLTSALSATDTKADLGILGGLIPVPEGVGADQIQKILVDVVRARGWIIREQDDQKLVVFHQKGVWVSQLTLTYTTKEITIYSNTTHDGKVRLPDTWIDNIRKDTAAKFRSLSQPAK